MVTANKALLAVHGAELAAAAEARGAPLALEEAASPAASPPSKAIGEGLAGNRISRIASIRTEHLQLHPDPDGASADANSPKCSPTRRTAGFAEADPSFDIDGIDAALELAILAALAIGLAGGGSSRSMSKASAGSPPSTSRSPRNSAIASNFWASPAIPRRGSKRACILAWPGDGS